MIKNILIKLLNKIKEKDNNYYIILLVTIILSMPLISKKYLYGHDTLYHISNIEAIKNDILNLNFSHIASQIAFNFGYGGAIFYPKLPHIFSALISILIGLIGMNGIYAMKISQIVVMFLSAFFMYKLLTNILRNKNIALLGGISYITMPYFITEIYVRSSFNETFIFLFMPIIFLGLIKLFKKEYNKFYIYFVLGYLGIMNSHLVLSVYFTVLVCIFLLFNIKKIWNKEIIVKLIKASCLILIFALPSVIQMIEHKKLGIYAVFESDVMGANIESILANGLRFRDFIIPKVNQYNNMYVFINTVSIIFSIFGVIYLIFKEKNKKTKSIGYGILGFTIMSIWLSSKWFPYKIFPSIMLSIQFAFRSLVFSSFGISMLAAYGLSIFNNNIKSIITKCAIAISCLIVLPFINNTQFHDISSFSYDSLAGMGFQREYLTLNAHKNIDYIQTRENNIKVLNNKDNIEINIIENKIPNS